MESDGLSTITMRSINYMLSADLGTFAYHSLIALMAKLSIIISSEALFILALCTVILAMALRSILYFDPNRRLNLPPGPRPWPLIGNLLVFVNADTIHSKLRELAKVHGPMYTVWIGSYPTVVLSGIKSTRDAMVRKGAVFSSRPNKYSWQFFTNGCRTLLTSPASPYWHNLRRVYSKRMLSTEAVAHYAEVRTSEINKSVEAFRRAQASSESSSPSPSGFDPEPIIRMQMSNIITRMNFGDDFDAEGQEVPMGPGGTLIRRSVYMEALCERYRTITMGSIAHLGDYIPCLRNLPASKTVHSNYKSLEAEVKAWMMPLVKNHRRELAARGYKADSSTRENFIDIFMSLEGEEKLSNIDIMWILVELVMGATDTTTGTTHWALAHCLAYPDAQRRLYDEIVSVVGHDRAVEEADLSNLPYLQAFVKETLRIKSPVALGAPHSTTHDCNLAGYDIPAKTDIIVHAGSLAHDEEIWDSPQEFRPERFLSLTDAQRHAFIPFGLGKRICPGMHMGLLQVQITIATLVQTFEWIPADPESGVDLSEKLHFIVIPNINLRASIRERNPKTSSLRTY
ncbi:unnamed protein product [Calypogeia fissa]